MALKIWRTEACFGDLVFGLLISEKGLVEVVLPDRWSDHAGRHYPADGARTASFRGAFERYFGGQATAIDVPLDMAGTPFQRSVWTALRDIPFGAVTTYGAIAVQIGRPRAVRATARAIGGNPLPLVVPCHRVVGADGTLTGYRGGLLLKQQLLALEGVTGLDPRGHARFQF